jgi:CheY-like chemotaxis protein
MPETDGKSRILLIDDESSSVLLLRRFLEPAYDLRISPSGEDALRIINDWPPDLILLDIELPGISGIETCRRISGDPRYANIPIIMVTARTEDEDLRQGLESGAIDYIRKPFSQTELKARVKSALRLRESMELLNRSNREKEEMIMQLRDALNNVRTLSGLLPICSFCKSIRNDQGYWERVEKYISEHSEATFTHGMCEECAKKMYPELFRKDGNRGQS